MLDINWMYLKLCLKKKKDKKILRTLLVAVFLDNGHIYPSETYVLNWKYSQKKDALNSNIFYQT